MVLIEDNKCFICDRLSYLHYVENHIGKNYCFTNDLELLESLNSFYGHLIGFYVNYGSFIPKEEIYYIFEGYFTKKQTKQFLEILIYKRLLFEKIRGFVYLDKK